MLVLLRKMTQNTHIGRSVHAAANYEEAITALYNLQSNAAYLQSVKQNPTNNIVKLKDTEKYMLRSGITLKKLDSLSVIHVAGTKGKGSTCAFTESILRKHGFRTGFFSSPHLVTVRERIRIDGQPISISCFTHHFWKLYKKLEKAKEHDTDMPTYFKFLTLLMFNVFLDANIDVAIVEVGIGGEVDCTNVVKNPVCVGITSLGLEHTSLLGNTLEEIAFQKSGIFKPNTVAFVVPQPQEVMQVFQRRAIEKGCTLHVVPPFESYMWQNVSPVLSMRSHVQQQNASLAIQLAKQWILSQANKTRPFILDNNTDRFCARIQSGKEGVSYTEFTEFHCIISPDKIATALSSCKWPGRTQILRGDKIDFFIDGAHTIESIKCCISWFKSLTCSSKGKKLLIFNVMGERDSSQFLILLKPLNFHKAYFVPNFAGVSNLEDDLNLSFVSAQKPRCKENCKIWGSDSIFANSISEVLEDIKKDLIPKMDSNESDKVQVLVTGSLYLVGAVLTILDPDLTMTTKF